MKRSRQLIGIMALSASLVAVGVHGAEPATVVTKEELAAKYPALTLEQIHDGPISGFYELAVNAGVSYISTDGRYLIRGEIIDLQTKQNLTATRLAQNRAEILASIDPATEIVFAPQGETKHRIFVFTDVDCGYCRQLHREIALINQLGIEVDYLAYPRTGPNTTSWTKAEGVWCAPDRNAALTDAKRGGEVKSTPECASNPVAKQYELAHRVGVNGTPAVFAENGTQLGGYVPAADLFRLLEEEAGRSIAP